jgi:transposase
MNEYKIIGIDLAKSVFQVCGLNQANKMILNKKLNRARFAEFIQQLPVSTIAMEACGSSQYVKPYVQGNKNDHNDALAICEAAQRPHLHFVPVKSPAQQDMQMLHRIRAQHVAQNTVLANQIRAYLRENGIIMPKQIRSLLQEVPPFWRMPKTA